MKYIDSWHSIAAIVGLFISIVTLSEYFLFGKGGDDDDCK